MARENQYPEISALEGRTAEKTARYVGPYRLMQLLGEGGMGEVWLAEQTEPLHRTVAVKLIKAGMDTKAVVALLSLSGKRLRSWTTLQSQRFTTPEALQVGRPRKSLISDWPRRPASG